MVTNSRVSLATVHFASSIQNVTPPTISILDVEDENLTTSERLAYNTSENLAIAEDEEILEDTFHSWVWALFTTLSFLGAVINSVCFWRTLKMLHIQSSLYILVMTDSISSLASTASFFLLCVFMVSTGMRTETTCTLLFVTIHTPSLFGIITTAEIAAVRFVALRRSLKNHVNNDLIFSGIVIATILILVILIIVNTIVHVVYELPLAIVSETCLFGDHIGRPFLVVSKLIPILPLIFFLLVALVFDFLIVRLVKQTVAPDSAVENGAGQFVMMPIGNKAIKTTADETSAPSSTQNKKDQEDGNKSNSITLKRGSSPMADKSYDAIPTRATVWSAFTMIPYLFIGASVGAHATVLGAHAATIIGTIALTLNAVRFPISLLVTFNSNLQRVEEDRKNGNKEARQQKVRAAALRQRDVERRLKAEANNNNRRGLENVNNGSDLGNLKEVDSQRKLSLNEMTMPSHPSYITSVSDEISVASPTNITVA